MDIIYTRYYRRVGGDGHVSVCDWHVLDISFVFGVHF